MTAYVEAPSYLRVRRKAPPSRIAAFAVIAALHVLALGALFYTRHAEAPETVPQTMMVSFISETPKPEPEPPPPPEPVPPKPQPKMVASTRPTPAAIQAPPIEEPPQEQTPVDTPPQPVSPPAPAEPQVIPPNFVAAYLNNPGPKYPQTSIRLHEQGIVMLLVLVNAQGRAEQVTIDKSSGYSRLDDAAVDVIKNRWRFVPAKQGDKAVAAWVRIPMSFSLNQH